MSKYAYITEILAVISILALSNTIEAQPQPNRTTAQPSQTATGSKTQEKIDIINRDQIDSTDIYAIPLDDSEVEDEEELNRLERKEVFPLPHSKGVQK
jgi:hypothetical protein